MISAKSLRCFLVLCAFAGIAAARGANAPTQEAPPLSPAQVVKAHTYVSLEPVPRGKDFEIAVVVDINEAYHMNSHKPSDAYLIPTTLTPKLPDGIALVDASYPAGHLKKFSFSDKPLDVYAGKVTLRLKLSAGDKAPIGDTTIPITLRYQACNSSACLPPVKIPLEATVKIAAAGAEGHSVHPEIFRAGK
jgi:DsbC/DsbD-like thiol-disulfide interchange protein